MSESDKIPLAFLARELALMSDQRPPKNRKLWELIVDGDLPAEQKDRRWYVKRTDLPAIAEILRQLQIARPKPRRVGPSTASVAA